MALNDSIEIRLYRADQRLNSGRWQAAWNEMSRHPAIKRDRPEATKLWMDICIALRKWSLGEKFGKLLVEQDPSKFSHWLYYGLCAEKARGVQGRFDVYSRAVEHHPYDGWVHYSLAKALCGLGRFEEASEALAMGLMLDPELKEYAMDQPLFSEMWEAVVGEENND
jgi:tetratricopeptide (TPR) repeat protein